MDGGVGRVREEEAGLDGWRIESRERKWDKVGCLREWDEGGKRRPD